MGIYKWNKHFLSIFLMFLCKIIICTYFCLQGESNYGLLVVPQIAGDTFSYYGSMENFITKGVYNPFYRLPGVALPYFIFRFFFTIKVSYLLVVYFQILMDAVASYFLAYTISMLIKLRFIFIITYVALAINTYQSIYNIWLTSDSLATSTLVIGVCLFYWSVIRQLNYKLVFLSGLSITWCVFCRPIYIPVLFFILVFYFIYSYINDFKNKYIKILILFLIVFVIIDITWMYAGYKHTNSIIPLEHNRFLQKKSDSKLEAYDFPAWKLDLAKYVQAFGGDIVDWNPEAEIYWFNTNTNIQLKSKIDKLPDRIYTSYYNQDSLIEIKHLLSMIIRQPLVQHDRDSIQLQITDKLSRYTSSYKSEKPFIYYIGSRFIVLKKLLIQNPTYNLYQMPFSELKWYEKSIKLFYFLMYYLYFFGFILLIFISIFKRNLRIFVPIFIISIYGITIYPILKLCEYRYLVPIMPFVIVLSVIPFLFVISSLLYGKDTLSRLKYSARSTEN